MRPQLETDMKQKENGVSHATIVIIIKWQGVALSLIWIMHQFDQCDCQVLIKLKACLEIPQEHDGCIHQSIMVSCQKEEGGVYQMTTLDLKGGV